MAEEVLEQQEVQQEANSGPGDKVGRLYSAISQKFNVGDENTFRQDMQDATKRSKLYSAVSKSMNIGTLDQFNGLFGTDEKPKQEAFHLDLPEMAPQEMPAADATRTQFTQGADKKSGAMLKVNQLKKMKEQDDAARLATARNRMKSKGIPETKQNLDSTLAAVGNDIDQGNLSITHDKDGNPIYGRNASFLEGLETGFKENITSLAYSAPLIWYGYINKDPQKLRETLENEREVQDFIRNNPQGFLAGSIPIKFNTSGDVLSYNGAGGAGQMLGGMAPVMAATALTGGAGGAAEAATKGVGITPELIQSVNPILAKTAAAGAESMGANLTRVTQQLYDENKAANLEAGMTEDEAKDKAAKTAVEDAPLQAFAHSVPDALLFGGAAGAGGEAAKNFLGTVEKAAKRTVGFGAVGGALEGVNQLARKIEGYKNDDPGKAISDAALGWMGQAAAFELLPVLGKMPKYLQSEVKNYVSNNVSKPVLNQVLSSIPNGAEIGSQIEKWEYATGPLKGIVPPEKMASVGGATLKAEGINNDIQSLEAQKATQIAESEAKKATLPEALHPAIDKHIEQISKLHDERIADLKDQAAATNKQIEAMLNSDEPLAHEYDDATGQAAIIRPEENKVAQNIELKSVPEPEPEVKTKGVKIQLPETNKTPERLKLNENVEKETKQTVSQPAEAERIQPSTTEKVGEKETITKPKTSGFGRLKDRKIEEANNKPPEVESPAEEKPTKREEGLYRQAANIEDHTPEGSALSYFANGGKISDAAIEKLFGKGRLKGKSTAEINSRISMRSNKEGAATIDEIAHQLWESAPEEMQNQHTTQDYRNAIEEALTSNNSRSSMARELVRRNEMPAEAMPEEANGMKASEQPDFTIPQEELKPLVDIHGKEIEGMPFQHKSAEVDPDLADMKFAVKEQIDKGVNKLSDIQAVAKQELGDLPEYADHPKRLRDLVEDAFHEVGKESTPKEITHGVIGAVSKWLDSISPEKGKKVSVLSNTDSMLRKLSEFDNEPTLHLNEKGDILGFAHKGKIYLNSEHLNPNTPIHEAGHIWTDWAKENNRPLYDKGMKLMEKSRYYKKVKANEFYRKEASRIGDPDSYKYEEYMKQEALAMAIGDKGAQFVTESQKNTFRKWLNNLWYKVSRVAGLNNLTPEQIGDLKLKDITKGAVKEILGKGEKTAEVKPKVEPVKPEPVPTAEPRSGINNEMVNKTAKELGMPEIKSGTYLSKEESLQRGRDLLNKGVDPESVLSDDSRLSQADRVRVARAFLEQMSRERDAMTPEQRQSKEGRDLEAKYYDYLEATQIPLRTGSGEALYALQGATDAAGNYLELAGEFREAMKRKPTAEERADMERLTSRVKELEKQLSDKQAELVKATDESIAAGEGGSGSPEAPRDKKFTERAKKLANVFRKAKQKPFTFTDSNGNVIEIQKMGVGWNEIIEYGAKVIEKTGEIADGVAAIIEKIKDEGFFKSLSDKDKQAFENQLHDHFENNVVANSAEARNLRKLQKELADLKAGNVKEKAETRELSDREKALKEEISAEKDRLGIGKKPKVPVDKAEQAIKRYEKQLADLEAGVKKNYTDRGYDMTPEQEAKIEDLKFQIKIRKESMAQAEKIAAGELEGKEKTIPEQAADLQDLFADKKGNDFSPQEAQWIWNYMKAAHIDKGVSYPEALSNTARDLGLTFDQINHAVITPKTKAITDEMWKRQGDLQRGRNASKRYVEQKAASNLFQKWKGVQEIPRAISVFGHAGVFVGTHAKRALLNPRYTKMVVKAFINGYKAGYGRTELYEGMMNRLRSDENYLIAQRAGLKNNPDQVFNVESENVQEHYFGKAGSKLAWFNKSGERGFNAIKVLRQEMFNFEYNKLPEELKSDPAVLQKVAQMINVSTGATNLKVSDKLNNFLFSAGLEANRWETIIKQPKDAIGIMTNWKKSTPAERYALKMYGRNLGTVSGVLLGTLSLNNAINSYLFPGDDTKQVNITDPSKSSWLRYNIAGNVSDMTGGAAATMTFLAKLINISIVDRYKNKRLASMVDVGEHYAQGKLAPFYSMLAEVIGRHDFSGNTMPWSDERPQHAYNHKMSWNEYIFSHSPLPIAEASRGWFDDVEKQGADHDHTEGLIKGAIHFLMSGGLGVTYYHKEPNEKKKENPRKRSAESGRRRRRKRSED